MDVRKVVILSEEIYIDGRRALERPLRRVAVSAVLANPLAGRYEPDLSPLIEQGEALGELLAGRAVAALDGSAAESFGKGGIAGLDGELEHVAALLHPKLGGPVRAAVGGGTAIIPSAKKQAGAGVSLDVPLHYKDAAYVRSHYDAIEVRIADAPRPDELVIAVALSDGGRPHPRIGGLAKDEVKGEDGLR
jgi:hypothetical protein